MSEQLEPELERVARMLADAGPLPDAPATLRERALAVPDGGQAADADADLAAAARRRRQRRPRAIVLLGVAAAVAAIAIVPTVLVTRGGDVGHRIDLAGRSFAPQGGGTAHVVTHGDGSATIELRVWKLPRPGTGRVYEAWLGRSGDRRPLGVFRIGPDGKATVSYTLKRSELGGYRWLWVTSEPAENGGTPSDKTALWGPLT